ncbi:glucose-6-phosphate exchanger SLC37A2, partial [Nephila pilipes]
MNPTRNNAEIGGMPLGITSLQKYLPLYRKGRQDVIRPVNLILTYVAFAMFCGARRPITVVQLKIIKECNASVFGENATYNNYFGITLRKGTDNTEPINSTNDTEPINEPIDGTNSTEPINGTNNKDNWCSRTVFEKDSQTFMLLLGSLFLGSYGVFVFFSGILADYFNPRYIVTWGSLMGSFFMIVVGLTNLWKVESTEYFAMAITLFGVAQSTAWPVLLSCATYWYAGTRRGLFFSVWNTHFYVGSFFGILAAGSNVEQNWGNLFFVPAAFVALIGIIIFFFLVIHPTDVCELENPVTMTGNREEKGIY